MIDWIVDWLIDWLSLLFFDQISLQLSAGSVGPLRAHRPLRRGHREEGGVAEATRRLGSPHRGERSQLRSLVPAAGGLLLLHGGATGDALRPHRQHLGHPSLPAQAHWLAQILWGDMTGRPRFWLSVIWWHLRGEIIDTIFASTNCCQTYFCPLFLLASGFIVLKSTAETWIAIICRLKFISVYA